MGRIWRVVALLAVLALGGSRLEDTFASVAVMANEKHRCTAFSVAPTQWLTASHCLTGAEAMFIRGEQVSVLRRDDKVDLLLVRGPMAPSLPIAKVEPELGDEVIMLGWPVEWPASEKPLPWWGRVQAKGFVIGIENWPPHPMNVFQHGGGRGMSGGPILNTRLEVIGVLEAMAHHPGIQSLSSTTKTIRQFLGKK